MKRVFLIVLDSFGIGNAPDAAEYSDIGSNTIKSISSSPQFEIKTMRELGLFNIDGVDCGVPVKTTIGAYGRLFEASKGKDTTIGHWEICGVVSEKPLPTYPDGFPESVIAEFEKRTGRKTLCNKPFSGTEVIAEYGEEHMKTGALIVYTSADSVFQIAAHDQVVSLEELYDCCRIARELLTGEHGVGRVIARPFTGEPGDFKRTADRHDFSIEPPAETLLDELKAAGQSVIAIGKINDIFAGRGITESIAAKGNAAGMTRTEEVLRNDFGGLCFVNLVDFDMLYGHRNDVDGYAAALTRFDRWLAGFIPQLGRDDLLIITADHGCDPATESTDHSREAVPLLIFGGGTVPENLGSRNGFYAIADTIRKYLIG